MKSQPDPALSLHFLRSKFSRFRAKHRSHTRIPAELREAVVAAVAGGLEPKKLVSALRLSKKQIEAWQHSSRPLSRDRDSQTPVRILDVIPDKASGLKISYEAGKLILELSF